MMKDAQVHDWLLNNLEQGEDWDYLILNDLFNIGKDEYLCMDEKTIKSLLYKALLQLFDDNTFLRQKEAVRKQAEQIRKQFKNKECTCEKCGVITTKIELHHIKPVACGGNNEKDNLQLLCHKCHKIANKQAFYLN